MIKAIATVKLFRFIFVQTSTIVKKKYKGNFSHELRKF